MKAYLLVPRKEDDISGYETYCPKEKFIIKSLLYVVLLKKSFMNKHLYIFLVFLCPLFVNTLKSQDLNSIPPIPPKVGDCLADGVVFYIFQPGDAGYIAGETHGLVVSLDQCIERLGCYGTDLPTVPNVTSGPTDPETAVGARIGDGKTNTDGMVQDCPEGKAAIWCRNKGPEWFLPSRDELNELYKWYAKDKRGNRKLMENCGGIRIKEDWHWSSSELRPRESWGQFFTSGGQVYGVNTKTGGVIRAVRAF